MSHSLYSISNTSSDLAVKKESCREAHYLLDVTCRSVQVNATTDVKWETDLIWMILGTDSLKKRMFKVQYIQFQNHKLNVLYIQGVMLTSSTDKGQDLMDKTIKKARWQHCWQHCLWDTQCRWKTVRWGEGEDRKCVCYVRLQSKNWCLCLVTVTWSRPMRRNFFFSVSHSFFPFHLLFIFFQFICLFSRDMIQVRVSGF